MARKHIGGMAGVLAATLALGLAGIASAADTIKIGIPLV